MLPESHITAPLTVKNAKLTEARFNILIDQVVNSYRDVFHEYGMHKLMVNRQWESEKINASAARGSNNTFLMNIYGGLGRYEPITDDAFMLILCHEVGHLIGGAPTMKPQNNISSEGQADYFSTAKCFRKIAQKYPEKIPPKADIHPLAREKCRDTFSKDQTMKAEICLRSSLAQESLARTMAMLSENEVTPKLDTPDPEERTFIIFNGYPSPQCRIDTLFSASLCHRDENELLDLKKYNKGVCSVPNGDIAGVRPRCWYVPRID